MTIGRTDKRLVVRPGFEIGVVSCGTDTDMAWQGAAR
jgi:hypothetical protein